MKSDNENLNKKLNEVREENKKIQEEYDSLFVIANNKELSEEKEKSFSTQNNQEGSDELPVDDKGFDSAVDKA